MSMGSRRSLKIVAADGYILGMDQSTEVGLLAQAFVLYTTSKLSINWKKIIARESL